jgi:integrase
MKRSGFPKHVTAYWRAGKKYVRARRHGVTYYFTSLPGTDEFALEYQRWLAGEARTEGVGASTTKPGSVSALIAKYYRSAEWANLSASTQVTYRGILERFRTDHGDKPVKLLERRHVCDMHAARANTPAAANNLVRMIRILMQFAINEEWRKDDPTVGIKMLKVKGDGFHSWTDDEIAAFEARWSIGIRERLALGVLLYTGQRRGDVVHMGRQHVTGYKIAVLQEKTKTRLVIPLHPELRKIIDATPTGSLNFLCTSQGKPFTSAGFGNWFRDACDAAGLHGCSAHGLRKAAGRRLAEAGCSPHQIAAILGHKTLKETTRYCAAADQEKLAEAAILSISTKVGA